MAYFLPAYAYARWAVDHPAAGANSGLYYYIEAERLDPIFAIEGTDPVKLKAAIASLLAQKDQIAQLYPADKRQTIETILYPDAFLNDLPDLEAARQTLLSAPSTAHVNTYHALLMQAIGDYAAGAQTLAGQLSAIAQNPGLTTPGIVGYIGGDAVTSDIAVKINQVAMASLAQQQKETARFACIQSSATNCPSLTSLTNARNKALATPPTIAAPNAAVQKTDSLLQHILPLLAGFTGDSKQIYAAPSTCYPDKNVYFRVYYNEEVAGKTGRKQDYLDDAYFYDIPAMIKAGETTPLFKDLTDAGVALEYQSPGNLYMCPDSGFDVTSVGSIIGTLEGIAAQQTQTPASQKLLTLPVVQKSDLAPYVRQTAQTETPAGDALAERYLEGSADFDQIIMGAFSDNSFLVTWDKKENPVDYEFMLIVRNFASMTFLMGNPTFVPQKISLFTDHTPNPLSRFYLREYLNDASKQYTDEQVMTQVKNSVPIEVGANLRT